MLDPQRRWAHVGEKPDYAGLLSFCGLPYTEDPAELEGVDVAIVGAPMDELVSERPGTRWGPRAIRAASAIPGPHLEARIDPFAQLRVVDFGDAAIQDTVGQVLDAGALPRVLGGDHSIAEPDIRACAAVHGPVGLVHFDAHTDTAAECFGVTLSHGTPMYNLASPGTSTRRGTCRSDCAATGPATRCSNGSASAGSRRCSCTTSRAAGSTRWWPRRSRWSVTVRCS